MKTNKRKKMSKKVKFILCLLLIILTVLLFLVGHKVYVKYFSLDDNETIDEEVIEESIELDNYDYFLRRNATSYEKGLAEELKTVLSNEEVNFEEYAKVLTKLFVSDLFTLNNKKSGSDITSSQYVYDDCKDKFKIKVKDTIYSNVNINLDGTSNQNLPVVTNVEVTEVNNKKFLYNGSSLDDNAYWVKVSIEYDKDLGYPASCEVVLIKVDNLLQVVKVN